MRISVELVLVVGFPLDGPNCHIPNPTASSVLRYGSGNAVTHSVSQRSVSAASAPCAVNASSLRLYPAKIM